MKPFVLIGLLLAAVPAFAEVELTLTTPETSPSNTHWEMIKFAIDRRAEQIDMVFREPTTEIRRSCSLNGQQAIDFIQLIRTADLTTENLDTRVIVAAQGTGCLGAGTISGTP